MATGHFPKVVFCAGLPRSASTWAFNAIRLILNEVGVCSGEFADRWDERLAALKSADSIVLKMHDPDISMCMLSRLCELPVVITIRDPRDCVASLMAQFGYSFEKAIAFVGSSAEALLRLYEARPGLLLLRYEDSVSEPFDTLKRLAEYLSVDISHERLALINEQLLPGAVEKFIGDLAARNGFDEGPYGDQWDASTHWHPNHVGDQRVGKYKDTLSEGESASVSYATQHFCKLFGYDSQAPAKLKLPAQLLIGAIGTYLSEGFSKLEPWGVWTDGTFARMTIPLASRVRHIQVELECVFSPSFLAPESTSSLRLELNGKPAASIDASHRSAGEISLTVLADIDESDEIVVTLTFENLRSPAELGIGDDPRKLGVGLRSAKITDRSSMLEEIQ